MATTWLHLPIGLERSILRSMYNNTPRSYNTLYTSVPHDYSVLLSCIHGVVLTLTRIIKSTVTGQAPVTLELRNTPEKTQNEPKVIHVVLNDCSELLSCIHGVVVVLTLTRIIKSTVTGQAPVTLELRNTPGKSTKRTKDHSYSST